MDGEDLDPWTSAYLEALTEWAEIGKNQQDFDRRLKMLEWTVYVYVGLHLLALVMEWAR